MIQDIQPAGEYLHLQLSIPLADTNAVDMLTRLIDHLQHSTVAKTANRMEKNLFEAFNEFIDTRRISSTRKAHYRVLARTLRRFEIYCQLTHSEILPISLSGFTGQTIETFADFLRKEPEIHAKYPEIYSVRMDVVETSRQRKKSKPRGENTVSCMLKWLRTFFRWAEGKGYSESSPFHDFRPIGPEKYGRPYFISLDELESIADHDPADLGEYAIQRDIFVFQCLVGCRVGDLMRLKRDNVVDSVLEYIPEKTRKESPDTVRVPLTARARMLVEKYADMAPEGRLFPFVGLHKYNEAIKEIFTRCGVTRLVTVLDPATRQEKRCPINELASSHIARRTFIGNIYRKVKDPSLVGALSGHKEGSRAFARYRDIDESMKRELVSHLEFN